MFTAIDLWLTVGQVLLQLDYILEIIDYISSAENILNNNNGRIRGMLFYSFFFYLFDSRLLHKTIKPHKTTFGEPSGAPVI